MRLSIGKQILAACIMVVVAFTGLNVYAYFQIKTLEAGYEGLINRSAPLVFEIKDINNELNEQAAAIRGFIITGDDRFVAQYNSSRDKMAQLLSSLEQKLTTPEGRQKFHDLNAALHEYHKIADNNIQIRRTKGIEAAIEHVKAANAKITYAELQIDDFVKFLSERMELRKQENQAVVNHVERALIVLDTIILIIAVAASVWLARRISRPLVAVAGAATRVAGGDLRQHEIKYNGQDEIGELVVAFTTMSANLRELVSQVARTSEQVAASSEELTASAEQSATAAGQVAETVGGVATGAMRQTEAVNQAVAVVGQMATAIDHIANSATGVAAKSDETAREAAAGNEAMREATAQMEAINRAVSQSAQVVQKLGASSKEIGEIVDVISGIAGQTNLLALNAAIEAARAGEQGRGFAVVAEEVRKLAEQSQEAAQKIAGIIKEIQAETDTVVQVMGQGTAEVAKGSQTLTATGERFRHIVALVQSLNQQIQEISAAAEELAASSSEVVSAVGGVKQVADETATHTQTISAAAEEQSASMQEIAASSQALARMAEELQAAIRNFKL